MKKITLSFLCLFSFWLADAQVEINESFDSGIPAGWTGNYWNTNDTPCSGSLSVAKNLYFAVTSGNITTPNLVGVSDATDLVISFSYKVVDFDPVGEAGPATPAGWGSAVLQYSTDDGANWTDVLTIDDLNHVVSTDCATMTAIVSGTSLPMGSDVKLQISNSWLAYDYFFYVDNFSANQTGTSPPNCDAVLTTPTNGATDVNENTDLVWSLATGAATGYRVTVGTTTGGNDIADAVDVGVATSYDLPSLMFSQTYYVTVVPYNAIGDATGCLEESFTVRGSQPAGEVCANPILMSLVSDCSTATPLTVDYANSTDLGFFNCDGFGANNGFWFEFSTGLSGAVNFQVEGVSNEYAVFDSCGGSELACGFINESLTLSGLAPSTTYVIAIWRDGATSGTSDICFEESCLFPTDLAVNVTGATTADISWTPGNTPEETAWEYVLQVPGTGVPTAAGTATTTNPLMLTGLTDGDSYELYLRADCGGGPFSPWSGPLSWDQIPPPAEDVCTGAINIPVGTDCSVFTVGNNTGATDSDNDPNTPAATCPQYAGGDIWFSFTVPASGNVTISAGASDCCFIILWYEVYEGADCGNLTSIACRDFPTQLTGRTPGEILYIRAWDSFNDDGPGDFNFCVFETPPSNEDCAGAEAITLGDDVSGNNTGATDSLVNGSTCFTGNIRDVWYAVEADDVGEIYVNGLTAGFQYAIYSDCAGNELSCNEGATGLNEGNTYYIRITDDGTGTTRASGAFTYTSSSSALSVTDFDDVNSFKYYPNPVNNMLTLDAQKNIESVVAYNMLGQEVLRLSPNTVNAEVDMSSLVSGAYFVKVSIQGATKTVRVIKQ